MYGVLSSLSASGFLFGVFFRLACLVLIAITDFRKAQVSGFVPPEYSFSIQLENVAHVNLLDFSTAKSSNTKPFFITGTDGRDSAAVWSRSMVVVIPNSAQNGPGFGVL